MKNTRGWGLEQGFALPTVMVASIVMLIVLLSGLVSASSVNTALKQQYFDRVTKEAVESGVAMADMCLAKNNQIPSWSTNPLQPNTDCTGAVISVAPNPSQYILNTPTLKTTFSVSAPIDQNGSLRVNVTATLYKYRTSGGGTPQTQTDTRSSLVGGQNSFSNVAFGYSYTGGTSDEGAQFLIVLPTGEVKGVGENSNSRLGVPVCTTVCLENRTDPVTFTLPVGEKGVSAYTSFLSLGLNNFVLTASGKVYGSGRNNVGQLGNTPLSSQSTPLQFGTIGNAGQPKGKFVATLGNSAYVMADNGSIYAAGDCTFWQLGTGCTSGSTSTPTRVNLPAVTSDPNTIPETDPVWVQPTNMAVDRYNAFVRMKGGYVYGWGYNDFGQMGNGTTTNPVNPIRITATPTANTPNFTQVAFDGQTLYLLDTTGMAWTTGDNTQGQQAGAATRLRNDAAATFCMQGVLSLGSPVKSQVCSTDMVGTNGAQMLEFWPDKTWRLRANYSSYLPTDSMYCVTDQGLGAAPVLALCNPSTLAQQWTLSLRTIVSDSSGGCIQHNGSNANVTASACNSATSQNWFTMSNPWLRPIPKPPGNPAITKLTTDNGSIVMLDANGKAWGAGSNNRGQLGIGAAPSSSGRLTNLALKQVSFPTGTVIADIYNSQVDPNAASTGTNAASYNNTYFILSDGTVWGAGANNFGQLGNGTISDYSSVPTKMTTLPVGILAKSVQTGFGTTVILTTGGKVYTVGNNSNGQLGDGTTTNSSTAKANVYTNQRSTIRY